MGAGKLIGLALAGIITYKVVKDSKVITEVKNVFKEIDKDIAKEIKIK